MNRGLRSGPSGHNRRTRTTSLRESFPALYSVASDPYLDRRIPLQIIIVLDICGAVFYLLMSGKTKVTSQSAAGSEALANASPTPRYTFSNQLQPAMAGISTGAAQPPPVPEWVRKGDRATDIYGLEGTAEAVPELARLSDGTTGQGCCRGLSFPPATGRALR